MKEDDVSVHDIVGANPTERMLLRLLRGIKKKEKDKK